MGHEQARTDRRGVAAPGAAVAAATAGDRATRPGPPDHDQRHAVADQDGDALARPARSAYGPWRTVATRFYHWTKSGLWQRILAELQRAGDAEGRLDWSVHMVDGTSIRAHRHTATPKERREIEHSAARPLGRLLTAAAALTDDRLLPIMASAASCTCAASGAADPSPSS